MHLEFDIDRAVYPELHRMLSRIADDASRSERVRQLASAALVYEAVRLQRTAALDDQNMAEPYSQNLPGILEETRVRVASSPDAMPETDFTPETEALQHAIAQAARLLPVLRDVVEPQTLRGRAPAGPVDSGDEADVLDAQVQHRTRSDEEAGSTLIVQKPATRSRLRRMKEKGLFHNE